jgi:HEAT repeat protein
LDLASLTRARNIEVRCLATLELGKICPPSAEVADALVLALKDAEPRVRVAAAVGLGSTGIRTDRTMRALSEASSDQDARVAEAAKEALQQLTK